MNQINFTIVETTNNIQQCVNSKLLSPFYFSMWSSLAPTSWSSSNASVRLFCCKKIAKFKLKMLKIEMSNFEIKPLLGAL